MGGLKYQELDTKRKTTEYDRSYKWRDSYRSPSYRPSFLQGLPRAGVPSIDEGNVFEPPLQRRKKPSSEVHSSQMFDGKPVKDEYVLLGDQSKFAPSVKYNLPHKERERPSIQPQVQNNPGPVKKMENKKGAQNGEEKSLKKEKAKKNCPVHGRDASGSFVQAENASDKEVKIDTDHSENEESKKATRNGEGKSLKGEDMKEDCPVHGRDTSGSVFRTEHASKEPKHVQNGSHERAVEKASELRPTEVSSAERSPPPAPRPTEDDSYKRKPNNYISRPSKPSMKTKPHAAPKKSQDYSQDIDARVPKKTATVQPPAPAPKPAPVSSKTTTKPGHFREKRKGHMNEFVQTDLTKGIADSGQEAPADYAMKYRAGIPPPRPRGPKRLSEYQLQYKWKEGLKPSPLLAAEQIVYNSNPHLAPYSNPSVMPKTTEYKAAFKKYSYKPVPVEKSEGTPAKKAKLQRSKSLEAITPDKLRAAGLHTGKRSEEDKRLLRESQNPTHIFFPHGKVKKVGSEYASNFKAPSAFAYQDGAWKGADPPHLQPAKNPIPVDDVRPTVPKEKDVGATSPTWFKEVVELRNKAAEYKMRSRGTHFSRQHLAQLYAQQADLWDNVSNSSTLSALSLESAGALITKKGAKPKRESPRESLASTDTSSSSRAKPVSKKKSKEAWAEEESSIRSDKSTIASSETRSSVSTLVAEEESEEGRVPTPKFRKDPAAEYKWRHHLDRTTPAVGGALLTSPPHYKYKASRGTQSDADIKTDTSTAKVSASWAGPVHTYGLPTRDTHVLVDEEASTDRTLPTKFTQSPPNVKVKENRPREFDIMPTLRETMREMKSSNSSPEDDILSMSARSVASSCSLASEVLDRARNRRDEFWGKPSKKASRS